MIHGLVIHLDDALTLAAVGFLDGVLNAGDGLILGQHARKGKEAGLHDGVDPPTQTGGICHLVGVDDVELQLLLDNALLHRAGKVIPCLLGRIGAVEEEDGAFLGVRQHIELLHKDKLVAADEVR